MKTTKIFIEELLNVFGNKYDYSKIEYINSKTKVCVICPKHGEFYTTPSNLLKKSGCPKCTNKKMFNGDDFIKLAQSVHNNKYDYSKVDYINAKTKVCIICPIHGEFWQRPSDHIKKQNGCQLCSESKLENEIQTVLNAHHIIFERQKHFKWLGKQSLDFYLPQYNIAIECQGLQHFRPIDFFGGIKGFQTIIENDQRKWNLTQHNSLQLLYYTNLKKKPSSYFGKIYNDSILLIENILTST